MTPSPTRLKPRTVQTMAMPGAMDIHGAFLMYWIPSDRIIPQSGKGYCAPKPKNPMDVVDRIADGSASVAKMIIVDTKFGKI